MRHQQPSPTFKCKRKVCFSYQPISTLLNSLRTEARPAVTMEEPGSRGRPRGGSLGTGKHRRGRPPAGLPAQRQHYQLCRLLGREAAPSPNSHVEGLTPGARHAPRFGNSRKRGHKVPRGHAGWTLITVTGVLRRGDEDTDAHGETTTGGHGKKVATHAPRREASGEADPPAPSTSAFPPPRLRANGLLS